MSSDEELKSKARRRAEAKAGFYVHLAVYAMVNLFLMAVWYTTGAGYPWFIFPLFGWGIAIVMHFIAAFRGEGYVDRMAEEEYRKLKQQGP